MSEAFALSLESALEGRVSGRLAREARYLDRLEKREVKAERMIGELCREGATVYYVFPVVGKYREGLRHEMIAFLIRNNYA